MKFRSPLLIALALLPLALSATGAFSRPQDVATLVAEIKKTRDEADPKLVADLAALRSREALEALIELYDKTFGSIYMRREVVKALATFDDVTDAQQPALQKLADVATNEEDVELRTMAVETLAKCPTLGKHYLKTIVESAAEDDIRQRAMEQVVRVADPAADKDFFERVFKGPEGAKEGKEKEKKGAKDAPAPKKAHSVKAVRELAFVQIAQQMEIAKLYEQAREKEKDVTGPELWGLRRLSLLEIERRKDKGLLDLAKTVYGDNTERGLIRAEAARIVAEAEGAKIAAKFLEDGRGNESVTPEAFRNALADQLARLRDEATDKKLVKMVGKGKLYEQRFVLRALKGYRDDPKLSKVFAKEVVDGTKKPPPKNLDPEYNSQRDLVLAIVETLATLGDKSVLPELMGVVTTSKDPLIVAGVIDGITVLRRGEAEWLAQLETLAVSTLPDVRNAALMQLGKTNDKKYVPILVKAIAHEDWATRNAALEGLVAMRSPEGVGPIVAQMEHETGLMLVRFADALWKLAGKPFRTSTAAWKAWWEKEGANFTPITLSELAKLEADEEIRRLKATTKAGAFFGIRIISKRVIFILDISGSMQWELESEQAGRKGRPRIDVAKEELIKAIDALQPESLFNIITFQSDVTTWMEGGIVESSVASARDDAKKYVAALGANGGTNLYGALELAFKDKDVDTIFVLSDGEPSVGEVTDQFVIRERVQQWNEHRGIVIHTIAVGGTFQILEWLAQDTNGSHRMFR